MKKVFVTLLIVLGFYGISHAQRRGDVEFGITAGGNLSYVESSYYDSDIIGGFNAGLSADYYFSRAWSLKVEASYQQKVMEMVIMSTIITTKLTVLITP